MENEESRAIAGRIFGSKLVDLWGIKNCYDIKIHVPLDGIVKVEIKFHMSEKQANDLEELLKKYKLVEIEEGEDEKMVEENNFQKVIQD